MIFTIAKKLNLAFLGLTLVVLVITLGLARWSFERGFLDYVNALEETRLHLLADSLSREYIDAGNSWSGLTERRFEALLWEYSPGNSDEEGIPPPPGIMLPPPGALRPGHPPGRPPKGRPPRPGAPMRGPPTVLYNADGQLVAGPLMPTGATKPIRVPVVVGEEHVGNLQSKPRRHFNSPQETAFARQQWITSALIAAVALIMAAVVSLLLTRVLLAPVHRTISGISRLSNGDYSSRLDEQRKDELGQLMDDLDRLAHKLEENRASRQRWLADISHELRTPVTVLTGELETIKDGIRPLDMQQVLSLDQEVARLRHLIDDLYELSVSDIGGLRYTFGSVDLQQCLATAVEALQMRAKEKGVELKVTGEIDSMINGDTQRLDQLFVNLLENSLAYTDTPGDIEIALSQEKGELILTIQDTPPGVGEEECEKLFEPLYRHEISRSRRTAGVGLGLAICRNIVDAHGGRISASPSVLGGLCIEVSFPVSTTI